MTDAEMMALLQEAVPEELDEASAAILEAAMWAAIEVTNEGGTPEMVRVSVLNTFRIAIRHAAAWLPEGYLE